MAREHMPRVNEDVGPGVRDGRDYSNDVPVADPLAMYIHEISGISLLSPKRESELVERAARGDTKARRDLIRANLPLVVSVAKRYFSARVELADKIQEGNIGLILAEQGFDYTKGYKFSTYAVWWIKKYVWQVVSENSNQQAASLDEPIDEDGNTLADVLPDRVPIDGSSAYSAAMKERLLRALSSLRIVDQETLRLRFGLDGLTLTLEEIGSMEGVTREAIRQREMRALDRLRKLLASLTTEE